MQVIETIASVLTVMGGWEAARYFISRKTNRRKEEAEAETAEFWRAEGDGRVPPVAAEGEGAEVCRADGASAEAQHGSARTHQGAGET